MQRDGIPGGNSFESDTPPRALDKYGVMTSAGKNPWRSVEDFELAQLRLRELRELGERQALIDYDPLTVPVDVGAQIRVDTADLRVGDNLNSFGRVKSIKRNASNKQDYDMVYLSTTDGVPLEEKRGNYNWLLDPLATVDGVTRQQRPTALSLFEYAPPYETPPTDTILGYDPLTVPVTRESYDRVLIETMRIGDNITGFSFGRLTAFEPIPGRDDRVMMVMNRDGRINRLDVSFGQDWDVEVIDLPNRDEIPTAFQVCGITLPAPF